PRCATIVARVERDARYPGRSRNAAGSPGFAKPVLSLSKGSPRATPPEPASHRKPFALCGEYLMLATLGKEARQRAADRQDIAGFGLREMQAQRAAVLHGPRFVEIQHARQYARVVVQENIAVAAVERPRRIECVVPFEGEKPEKRDPVHRDPERVERAPQRALGRRARMLVEPENAIAANVAPLDAALLASDAGGAEVTGGVAAP